VPRIATPGLIGRVHELTVLDTAWKDALSGTAGMLLVEGDAGVGKSRLVREFVQSVGSSGIVLTGACLPLRNAVPYAPVLGVLTGLGLAGFGAEERDALGDPTSRSRFFQRVTDALAARGRETPVLLVVEDLHWADEATVDLLFLVAGHARELPLLVLCTRRSDEPDRSGQLADLMRAGRVDRLRLGPLDQTHAAELVTGMVGALPSTRLSSILSRAEGNPFFLEELAHQADGELPDTVAELVLFRIERLPEPARQLLRLASVHGPRFEHRALERTAGLPTDALLAALHQVIDHRLLVADGDAYAFRHALIQECTYRALLPAERQLLHEAVATELSTSDSDPPPGELARHWDAAGRPAEALRASLAAARAAERAHAPAESYVHFHRVLDLWELVPDAATTAGVTRDELLMPAAHMASLAGHDDEAQRLARTAVASIPEKDHERRALGLMVLRRFLIRGGRVAAAGRITDELVGLVPILQARTRTLVLSAVAGSHNQAGNYLTGLHYAEEAAAAAHELGDASLIAESAMAVGQAQVGLGRPEGLTVMRETLALSRQSGDQQAVAASIVSVTAGLVALQRYDDAAISAEQTIAELSSYGLETSVVPIHRANMLLALTGCGRWEEAERVVNRISPSDIMDRPTLSEAICGLRLLIGRGHYNQATELLDATDGVLRKITDLQMRWDWLIACAELSLWRGRFTDAQQAVTAAQSLLRDTYGARLLSVSGLGARLEADKVDAARLEGRPVDAAAAAARSTAHLALAEAMVDRTSTAATRRSPFFERQLDVVRAEHHRLIDPADPRRWEAVASSTDEPYLTAYARWREGEALLCRHVAPAKAALALRTAHEIGTTLGAMPLLSRVIDLATRARIDLTEADEKAPEPAPPRPGSELGLTDRELQVLALVGRGLSNAQIAQTLFISPKTVSVHVTNILRKLDLTSRVQAAAVAHRAGLA
jgi:DNA-binding NarL/FixJ family response regulator